jgi:hypothetical protein
MLFCCFVVCAPRLRSRLYSSKMQKKIRIHPQKILQEKEEQMKKVSSIRRAMQKCSKPPFDKSGQELGSGRE